MRIVVVSCPRRKPIQAIWKRCQEEHWPDCPFPIDILSPHPDFGWNANLNTHLGTLKDEFILLMLDDNFLRPAPIGSYTENIQKVLFIMDAHSDIALIKLQAGGAHSPELKFPAWDRLREYDRAHHPFKRTNLTPSVYRRDWLWRMTMAVLTDIGHARDAGRNGAIEFEVTGTLLTEDVKRWPERMLGIYRGPNGSGGESLLECIANNAVEEGKMRPMEELALLCKGVPGIEAFL